MDKNSKVFLCSNNYVPRLFTNNRIQVEENYEVMRDEMVNFILYFFKQQFGR